MREDLDEGGLCKIAKAVVSPLASWRDELTHFSSELIISGRRNDGSRLFLPSVSKICISALPHFKGFMQVVTISELWLKISVSFVKDLDYIVIGSNNYYFVKLRSFFTVF